MADLATERGQIILIAAFVMAVTFVSLALVVNSAIFTENLASRGETAGSDDALVVRHEVQQSVGQSIEYANTYDTTSEERQAANVTESVATISDSLTSQQAETGKLVVIDGPTAFENGTRIRDNASAGGSTFENASTGGAPQPDWVVVENVERTRAFEMNLSDASGFAVTLAETSGTDRWQMAVTESSNDFTVTVSESGATVGSCTVGPRRSVRIDVTGGLVGGDPCPYLHFGRGIDGQYDLYYNDSDDVTGNYTMVVGEDDYASANLTGSRTDGDPYTSHAIYAADVTYRYDGPSIVYNTTVRVAPGEPR